jgi:hypothetical protein
VKLIEIHDFTILEDFDDDRFESSSDSGGDDYRGLEPSLSTSLCPWPRIYLLGFDNRGLTNSNEGIAKVVNSRTKCVVQDSEILTNSQPPQAGCLCRSIYNGRSRVSLQCYNCP